MSGRDGLESRTLETTAAAAFSPQPGAPLRAALIQEMWWAWVKEWPVQAPHERLYLYLRFDGADPVKVEAAVRALIARHDTLRSRFTPQDGQLTLNLTSADEFRIERERLESADEGQLAEARQRFAAEPLRIDAPWLIRARIVEAPGVALLCLVFHHMVFDARSRVLVEQELRAAVEGEVPAGRPQQFTDWAAWEQAWAADDGRALTAHWRRWLTEAPALANPAGGELAWRPGHKVYWEFEIGGEPAARLKAMVAPSTPFRALLAATAIAAARWSGQHRVVIRVVGDLRTSRPLADMVGNLVCTDILALDVPEAPDVAALMQQAGAANRAAVALRCPNLLGLADSEAWPDLSEGGVGAKTALTLNYMPLYKLRGGQPPAPGALGAWAPPVPTRSAQREYWPVPVCPINLRIWDWGERLVCRMEFDDDAIPEAEQRRLVDLFGEVVRAIPEGARA